MGDFCQCHVDRIIASRGISKVSVVDEFVDVDVLIDVSPRDVDDDVDLQPSCSYPCYTFANFASTGNAHTCATRLQTLHLLGITHWLLYTAEPYTDIKCTPTGTLSLHPRTKNVVAGGATKGYCSLSVIHSII